jgi:EmrB/QacA subfamily drug resistance transporter
MQWVVTGYLLSLAALLVVGGTLGDQLGRRRVFAVGVAWFTAASVACALAPDVTVLIATRVLQGAGAALLVPGSLAIIEASFATGDRGRAIGAWSGLSGVATAAGPLLGGYLVSVASWRWIFVINVPLGVVVLALSRRHVPESRQERPHGVDVVGAVLTVASLAGVTYGLIEGPAAGWTATAVLAMLSVGAAAGALFLFVERRRAGPMVPLGIFRNRQFTVTNALTLLVYAGLSGALFLFPVELEVVDHYSPLEAGAALLPLTAIMLVLSARSGRLASQIGPRLQMAAGPVVVGAGLALLALSAHDAGFVGAVLPGVVVLGLGLAVTVAPLTATAMDALSSDHAGLASAVNNDVSRLGGLVAVAVLPALAGIGGRAYLHPAAMAAGFRIAAFTTAAWCAAGGVVAAAGIRNPRRRPRDRAAECTHCALDATPVSVGAG